VLPDGSKVQLNAGAELSYMVYPHAETSIRRNVILKGEAFFDIATDIHRPFTVTTEKGVITVLSTRFNVRYYPKKDDFRVTLAQGAVKLQHDGDPVILHPGEEARIDKATKGACVVQAVDTALAFSWRSEKFDFSGKNIGQMMNDIEEWHGLEKSYFEESVDTVHPNLLGGGHIAKTFLLDDLLKQITDDFYFRCDGKRIVISKNHPAK
jgi:ferric-dicitrate binding protein FerR (iron transport regulator)